jgi:uncharacterized protein (TIGR02646 family)
MRKLNRLLANTPISLKKYDYKINIWDDFREKKLVWKELYKVQDKICVYCESPAYKGNGHIEHFFHKGSPAFTKYTFDWNNLFGCCDSRKHCGHYKDEEVKGVGKRIYDPHKLLKADNDNPDDFFQFVDTGAINVKTGISQNKVERAEVTINALNLDHSALNDSRESVIKSFKKQLDSLVVLSYELTELELEAEYEQLKLEAMSGCYRTALKQVLFS